MQLSKSLKTILLLTDIIGSKFFTNVQLFTQHFIHNIKDQPCIKYEQQISQHNPMVSTHRL